MSLGARFPPFFDQDITNTYKKIVEGRFMFPSFFPPVARDLVRKLLQVCCLITAWELHITQ